MSECYCAKIEGGVVTQVIVCDNDTWAAEHLGGEWVCTHERLVGVGWPVVDGEIVEPPSPDTPEPTAPASSPTLSPTAAPSGGGTLAPGVAPSLGGAIRR